LLTAKHRPTVARRGGANVELFRAQRDQGDPPEPLASIEDVWTPAAHMGTVGIFVLLLIVCLNYSRPGSCCR